MACETKVSRFSLSPSDIYYKKVLKETRRFDENFAKTDFGFSILDIYFCPFLKS